MEVAGLALGAPGLCVLLVTIGLQGYEMFTNTQNAGEDIHDCLTDIKIEYQKLKDWNESTAHFTTKITRATLDNGTEEERFRYSLIVTNLARIAWIFATIAEMKSQYKEPDRSSVQVSSSRPRRILNFAKRHLKRNSESRLLSMQADESGSKSPSRSRSRSRSPAFHGFPDITPENIELERLLNLLEGDLKTSVSSTQSVKWALLDKQLMEHLHRKLSMYNQQLIELVQPLLKTGKAIASHRPEINGCFIQIPYPRNPSFVGREGIFSELKKLLGSPDGKQKRAALWGLGGTGKTSVAVEYCHQSADMGSNVFWVHGNTQATFNASYRDIAKQTNIKITSTDDLQDVELKAVKLWLESASSGNWMMVIDNLDDLSIESAHIPIRQGTILFTTRDQRILGHPAFGISAGAGVELRSMSSLEATTLCRNLSLGKNYTQQDDSDALAELLMLLDNLPLAIAQAMAYMRHTRFSATRYLELFKASANTQKTLLDKPLAPDLQDEMNTSRTVMRTWSVTTQKVQNENPFAIKILQFMSLLDPEQIPLEIIQAFLEFDHADELSLVEGIGSLLSFSLLTKLESSSSYYRLHRLVSFWTRATISQDRLAELLEAASKAIKTNIPEDVLGNFSKCLQILPHALAVLKYIKEIDLQCAVVWDLQYSIAWIMTNQCQYLNALEWYQRALDGYEKVLGKDHVSTLNTVNNMASVFDKQGRYEEALEWYQRALDGYEKVLGKDHVSTLTTVNNMAIVFDKQGRYEEALEWYQRALDGYEKVLGKDHVSTLATVNNMALVFDNQGRYEEALEWYQRALDGYEKVLGKDHVSTLTTVHNMASVFVNQGRYEEALEWYQRDLDGCEKVLGKDHVSTLTTVNNMASVFDKQGRYEEALEWFQRALDGYEKVLGKDHVSTLDTIYGVGLLYTKWRPDNDMAIECFRRSRDGYEIVFGKDHSRTIGASAQLNKLLTKNE